MQRVNPATGLAGCRLANLDLGMEQEQAEQLLEDARMHAHQLRGEAKEQADHIVAQARAEAAERKGTQRSGWRPCRSKASCAWPS